MPGLRFDKGSAVPSRGRGTLGIGIGGVVGIFQRYVVGGLIFRDDFAGFIGLGLEHEDFNVVGTFGMLRDRKRSGGDGARGLDAGAFQQAANYQRFGGVFSDVGDDYLFVGVFLGHVGLLKNSATVLLCASRSWVHTSFPVARSNMDDPSVQPTQQEIDEESRRIRRLRILVHITLETIAGGDLSPEDAAQMVAETRKIALDMFPGKERAFDLIYRPQFQRVMHAVYRLQ